jgi:hypothetical protein
MPSSPPKEVINQPSLFSNILEIVILIGNVYGNGPFPFSIIVLIAFGGSYLTRLFKDESQSTLLPGVILTILYSTILGIYRVFVYNRYLDPLLAIPGPRVFRPSSELTIGALA